jgi:putative oxygen-independent coproporphyrinogen III oxidase
MEDWRAGGFGLYLHWPFCQSKCPYCDFNSHVSATIDQKRWQRAYLAEIARAGRETAGRVLETVYFGGGTPSLMEPELVAAILAQVRATWPMVNDPEITLEANPTSVEAGRFRGYRDAGVTRVSMGFQALDDLHLQRLGRLHSVADARRALQVAASVFDRVSFDLIYARQDQCLAAWRRELSEALAIAEGHLSLYQLTIEDGTAFGDRFAAGKLRGLPDEDLAADLYEMTQDMCGAAGYAAYEVSNHARTGQESRHNLIYWRGGDYLGIGPGAHGRLTLGGRRLATEAKRAPGAWLTAVEADGSGELPRSGLTPKDHATEYLLMSMRLGEGLDLRRFAAIAGRKLNAAAMARLGELGLLEQQGTTLRASASGRMVLNGVLRDLCADL